LLRSGRQQVLNLRRNIGGVFRVTHLLVGLGKRSENIGDGDHRPVIGTIYDFHFGFLATAGAGLFRDFLPFSRLGLYNPTAASMSRTRRSPRPNARSAAFPRQRAAI